MQTQTSVARVEAAKTRSLTYASLNAWAHLDWDDAKRQAQLCDQAAAAGQPRAAMSGWLVNIKDLYQVQGMPIKASTRAALPIEVLQWAGDCPAVARLRGAGAVIVGKTNLHEIALGATGENLWTGDVQNPLDPARQAGGSSSGAAVAVACGLTDMGLGSDTGGSIRIPASFCGVVGFKPSFGAVPLEGALPLSWRFDHAGPITLTVQQARTAFEVLAQRSTSHAQRPRAMRMAVPMQWLKGRMDPVVSERFMEVLGRLRSQGVETVEIDVPMLQQAWDCYTPIVRAQAAFVHREVLAKLPADGSMDMATASALTGFTPAVLQPMLDGRQLSAQQYLGAIAQARQVRRDLRQLLNKFDAMAMPTSAIVPPLRGQTETEINGGTRAVRELVLGQTLPFNVAGVPAITLPIGARVLGPSAAPAAVGLQLVAGYDRDAALLALAQWVEEMVNG